MLKSIGSTWVVTIAQILMIFVLMPFVIAELGETKYGVWLTITAITGYLTLIRGGLPAASVKYLAQAVATPDPEARVSALRRVVHSALWLYLVLAVVCFVAGTGMAIAWYHFGRPVPAEFLTDSRIAFAIVTINVAFGFVAHLPGAVMEAHDDFVQRNAILLGGVALQAALTFGLLLHAPSIAYLAITLAVVASFEILAGVWVVSRRYPGVTFGIAEADRALIGTLLHYGAWVLLLAAGARLAFNTDAMIIQQYHSFEGVGYYNVANQLALYFTEFIAAVGNVVMPRFARLRAANDREGLRATFLQWSKVSMSLALLVGSFLVIMGPAFIGFWINALFEQHAGPSLSVLVLSFIVFLPMRGAAVPLLMAVGDIKIPSIAFALMGVLNIAVSIALVPAYGILGAAIGTAIPNVLFAAVVFQIACREAETPRLEYLKYVGLKPLLGVVPVVAWLLVCRFVFHASGFFGLLYSGVVSVSLFGAIWGLFVYRNDPYGDPMNHPRLQALVARFRR